MSHHETNEPFEMSDAERQTDALLDAALSPDAVAGSCDELANRIYQATHSDLPTGDVVGRIDRSTKPTAFAGGGLSPAWRIAAVVAMGLMTGMVVAAWQVDISTPQVAQASVPAEPQMAAQIEAFQVTMPGAGVTDIDTDLDLLALQVEMLSDSAVFVSPDESLDEAVSLDQLQYWSSESTALF